MLNSLHWIGHCQYSLKAWGDAYISYKNTYVGYKALDEIYKGRDSDMLDALYWMGRCQFDLEEWEDARMSFETAYHESRLIFGDRHEDTLDSLYWIGRSNVELFHDKGGLKLYNKVLAEQKSTPELPAEWNMILQYNRALAYGYLGRHKESVLIMKHALKRWETEVGEEFWCITSARYDIASSLYKSNQYRQLLGWTNKVLAGQDRAPKLSAKCNLKWQFYKGSAYKGLGRYEKSISTMKIALNQWETAVGDDDSLVLDMKYQVARDLYKLHEEDEAIEWFQRSLAADIKAFGPSHPHHKYVLKTEDRICYIYHDMGRYSKELEWLKTVYARREKVFGEHDPKTSMVKDSIDGLQHDLSNILEESSVSVSQAPSTVSLHSLLKSEEIAKDVEHDDLGSHKNDEDGGSVYSLGASSIISSLRSEIPEEFFEDFEYPEIF